MDQRLQQLYEDAGRPGARAFRTYARQRGEQLTQLEAQQFVGGQAGRQVLQQRLPSDGKVSATREDMRWMGDLIDFSKRPRQASGHKYAMVVTDVHTRFQWLEPMKDKSDAEALRAYRRIVASNDNTSPKELSTDLGKEWGPTLQQYLNDQGTAHRQKDPEQINSIAAVDRGIQSTKQIMGNLQANTNQPWTSVAKRATSIYNDREHSALLGESPEGVTENPEVQYQLEKQAGEDIKHNNEKWRSRVGKLRENGGSQGAVAAQHLESH